MIVTALIPAAGSGRRMEADLPKQFLSLAGRPVVVHALQAFESSPQVQEIVLVVPPGMEDRCRKEWVEAFGFKKVARLIPGGPERQDSVNAGLQAASPGSEIIVVHDGVRPFVTETMIRETIHAAEQYGGAIAAIPVLDTTKTASSEGFVTGTLDRTTLWLAQTPQAFTRKVLMQAYQRAYIEGVIHTDDSALVERAGYRVKIVPGSQDNIKITRPDDLPLAAAMLKARHLPAGQAGAGGQESKP